MCTSHRLLCAENVTGVRLSENVDEKIYIYIYTEKGLLGKRCTRAENEIGT